MISAGKGLKFQKIPKGIEENKKEEYNTNQEGDSDHQGWQRDRMIVVKSGHETDTIG